MAHKKWRSVHRQSKLTRYIAVRAAMMIQETKEEHDRLLRQEDSPRLGYIEKFYLGKLRAGERNFSAINRRIRRIRRSSLKPTEKKHILDHLALLYTTEGLKNVPAAIRAERIKRRGKEYVVYRDPNGRLVKMPEMVRIESTPATL